MLQKNKRITAALCAVVMVLSLCVGYFATAQIQAATLTQAAASTEKPVLDLEKDVKYFGRTYAENGARHFSWSSSGFQFSFYGTGATATLKATQHTAGSTTETAYVKVYVDGVLTKDIAVPETATKITLATGLSEGFHTIKVIKRTSGYYTSVALSQIQLEAGSEIRETQKYFDRTMLFIGDDITTGYGSMVTNANVAAGSVPKYSTATEDSTITFAGLTADYFGAENMTVALSGSSGRGIVKNGGGSVTHTAPKFFEYLDYRDKRSEVYDHTQYNPDVIVVNLGTFDNKAGVTTSEFKKGCKNFLQQIRAAYPDAVILFAYGIGDTTYASTIQSVISGMNYAGDPDVHYVPLSTLTSGEKGISGRPTKNAHALRAQELIEAVEDIMGWDGADTAGNPIVSGVDTSYEPMEPTDITTMSYNVLAHNGSEQTYEAYSTRMAKVVTMIKAYDPDVIGLQEVAKPYDSFTHDWPGYLASNLSEYGYLRLDTQAGNSNLMRIGNGLMIMYKKDRFTLVSSGCKQFVSTANVDSISDKDTSRWFQWAQLKDKQTGTVFYFYNTHLSINPSNASYTSTQKVALGDIHRTNECATLAAHVASTSGANKCPFFIVGDFNTSISVSDKHIGTNREALNKLINYTPNSKTYTFFRSAAKLADYTRFVDYNGAIDHIFVNQRYVEVKEYHVAAEGVDGRRTSDHSPQIAHCDFRPHATLDGTSIREKQREISTTASTYTFKLGLGTDVTYDFYDGATKIASSSTAASVTVNLDQEVNRFAIHFKDGHGNSASVLEIIINCTSIKRPTLKATGSVVNSYFANGAYHVLVNGDTVNLATSAGNFYTNPYGSRGAAKTVALTEIPAGRMVYYLKSNAGDVYPVFIYKQTAQADSSSKVLYVDDDMGDTGTVAYYNGTDVIFVTAGKQGFGTVAAAAAKANSANGYTIYFAPGNYTVNHDASDVVFKKSVTLLGNNYDVSPIAINGKTWTKAGRKPETVINGGFIFKTTGNISVTIKGFTIQDTSAKGPIYIDDTTSSATAIVTHTQTLNIQNNILTGAGDGTDTAPAAIHAYSGAKVVGTIESNYFRCTSNQFQTENGYTRGTIIKNPDGLTMEGNYFVGYEVANIFSGHISNAVAGNLTYSVISNRFEHCGTSKTYVKGITADTAAVISYNKNDFVRCGGAGNDSYYALAFDFNENDLHNNFANIRISVLRSNFYDCYRALMLERGTGTKNTGNMAEMKLKIKANNFIQPTEGKWSKYFHSIRFSFLVDSTRKHNVSVSDSQWDFASNTFKSAFLNAEALSGENTTTPAFNYVYNSITYNGTSGNCFNLTANHFS